MSNQCSNQAIEKSQKRVTGQIKCFLTKTYEEMVKKNWQTVTIEIRQTSLNMVTCCQNTVARKIGKLGFFSMSIEDETLRIFKRYFYLIT